MNKRILGALMAVSAAASVWLVGCGTNTDGGLTVELSGCQGSVAQGDMVTLVATVTDAEGNDVTANAVFEYELTSGATMLTVSSGNNQGTVTVPAAAQLGAYVITATATVDGTTGNVECRFNVIEADDPCDGVTCDEGETCVNGVCVADDPCEGITCDEGETCVNGVCVADDPCDGITCDQGETCVDGVCVADDPCEGITCDEGETCVDGVCVADDPCDSPGDVTAGMQFYSDNGCANCHGSMGNNGFAPSLLDATCDELFDKLSGAVTHTGGTVEGVTRQDTADLAAYLGSL